MALIIYTEADQFDSVQRRVIFQPPTFQPEVQSPYLHWRCLGLVAYAKGVCQRLRVLFLTLCMVNCLEGEGLVSYFLYSLLFGSAAMMTLSAILSSDA